MLLREITRREKCFTSTLRGGVLRFSFDFHILYFQFSLHVFICVCVWVKLSYLISSVSLLSSPHFPNLFENSNEKEMNIHVICIICIICIQPAWSGHRSLSIEMKISELLNEIIVPTQCSWTFMCEIKNDSNKIILHNWIYDIRILFKRTIKK